MESQITDGMIIYSLAVSEFEKMDFKDDALAGVRANYFNSQMITQREDTEIELGGVLYKLCYNMSYKKPLSWKVTKKRSSCQLSKKATGGVYFVQYNNEKGILYKKIIFDRNHSWLRNEYYSTKEPQKLLCVMSPDIIDGVLVINKQALLSNGNTYKITLYPSKKMPNKNCEALVYSNKGMVWYSSKSSVQNEDEVVCDNSEKFKLNTENLNSTSEKINLDDAEYIENLSEEDTDVIIDKLFSSVSERINEHQATNDEASEKSYSAYDKIENILSNAQSENNNVLGTATEEISEDSQNLENLAENSTDEQENTSAIDNDTNGIVALTKDLNFHNDNTQDSKTLCEDKTVSNIIQFSDNKEADYDVEENETCDMVIANKSGRYKYFGSLDENNYRSGKGRTVSPKDLTAYDGEYKNDKRDGFGVFYYSDGSINYVGNWVKNVRSGSGVGYRLSDKTMHVGKWNNNTPDDFGARFDEDGNFIDVCHYDNGVRNGTSVSFDENGNVVITIWKDGEKKSQKVITTGDMD